MAKKILNHVLMSLAALFLALTGGYAAAQQPQPATPNVVAITDNAAGGIISFYDASGPCPAPLRHALSKAPDGASLLNGCWMIEDGAVYVYWIEVNRVEAQPVQVLRAPGKAKPAPKGGV